jgi:acyl dehydratase
MSQDWQTYKVSAFNTATASSNKIHDDSVARRFGFRGGLVPGVEVYAYMAHMPVARWGRVWLERGEVECRFYKPVYDGVIAHVTATEEDGGLALVVESEGECCATGSAVLPDQPRPVPSLNSLPSETPPEVRPNASNASLAPDRALGIAPWTASAAILATYLDEIRETDPVYRRENLVHPGQILRLANQALVQNVVLGPWIHVGSKVGNHAVAHVGQELTVRANVTSNVVSKGHAIVEFDAIVVADGTQVVAELTHTAIWRPRQVAEAEQERSGAKS